jgi:hypothetical protein
MAGVEAIVLTCNEGGYILDYLESLSWCHRIRIVDSFSTDATLEIACQHTENIVEHA